MPTRAARPTRAAKPIRTSWAGVPAQDRRAARRQRLLDAAFDLLGGEGAAATTVRAVCQRAQLNPRYFYESFEDLDALLIAVYERTVAEMTGAMLAAVESARDDPTAQTRAAIDAIVRFVDEDRRRGRVIYTEALGNEALNRYRLQTGAALVELVERSARERVGAQGPTEAVGRMGAAILVSGFAGLLQSWLDGRVDVPRKQLVDDATTLFLSLAETSTRLAADRRRGRRARGAAS